MKHGLISDVHSSLPALEVALAGVDGWGGVDARERAVEGVVSSDRPDAFAGQSRVGGNPEPVEVS